MIGTIVNTATIIVGSSLGTFLGRGISEEKRKIMLQGIGLSSIALGITWIVNNISDSKEPVLFIVSMVLGGLIGETFGIEKRVNKLGDKMAKTGNRLIEGLTTAILLFCIGTLSILGPIDSALNGDHTLLFTNAMLDGITSMILASTFGIGIMISAGILFLWQGSIYFLAQYIEPFVTDELMVQVSIIGGILIMSTGINILDIKKIKTINFIPALIIPMIYYIPFINNFFHGIGDLISK
jgi:uncharacterized membrane protein YqgA involved in biofilm formation